MSDNMDAGTSRAGWETVGPMQRVVEVLYEAARDAAESNGASEYHYHRAVIERAYEAALEAARRADAAAAADWIDEARAAGRAEAQVEVDEAIEDAERRDRQYFGGVVIYRADGGDWVAESESCGSGWRGSGATPTAAILAAAGVEVTT